MSGGQERVSSESGPASGEGADVPVAKAGVEAAVPLAKMRELLEVSRQFAVQVDLGHLLPAICRAATTIIGADRCSLFLYDEKNDQLWTKVAMGVGGGGEIRVPAGAGIVGLVFKSRAMLVIADAYADERFNRAVDVKTGYRTRNLLTVPVLDLEGKPVAVLQVVNKLGTEVPGGSEGAAFSAVDEVVASLLADQAGVAIQRYHLQQQAIEAVAMQREMDLARKVQVGTLPKRAPEVPGLTCAGWNHPASTTAGDAYDLWETKDGRLAVFVADATGHGIAPALVVSQARALVRVLADDAFEPAEILSRVNHRLAQDLDSGMFVTAFLGLISGDGELRWCSAGHGPVLVRRGPGEAIEELQPPAPPLGVMDPFMLDEVSPVRLEAGGWLAVVSDGITESWSPEKEQFGEERLRACLEQDAAKGPAALIEALREGLKAWQREREPSDDQTIVLVNRS